MKHLLSAGPPTKIGMLMQWAQTCSAKQCSGNNSNDNNSNNHNNSNNVKAGLADSAWKCAMHADVLL